MEPKGTKIQLMLLVTMTYIFGTENFKCKIYACVLFLGSGPKELREY